MNLTLKVGRIYHNYTLWEDFKHGFYDTVNSSKKSYLMDKVIELFNDADLTQLYMDKVIEEWSYSCEHNLSNESMNRIAYLGQSACCLYAGVPCDVTMRAWKLLPHEVQIRSNEIAKKTIIKWAQRIKSKGTLKTGKKKDMKTGYQMKLPFN